MAIEQSQDDRVLESLQILGIEFLAEWEALAFLQRHTVSLCTAAQIAEFMGFDKPQIVAALHRLEFGGLIRRSRVSQGIRFYRFLTPEESSLQARLLELTTMAEDRAGRLLLLKHLKRPTVVLRRKRRDGLQLA
jgi:DNA-binding MarR family transcriptional regulator